MAKKYYNSIIKEDRGAPANLPRNVIEHDANKMNYDHNEIPGDLYQGVSRQLEEDSADMKRASKPRKY
jgi:hypothetical protein